MLEITDGGEISPTPNARVRDRLDFEGMQSASLYSGGLDSAIGMLNLRAAGHKTVLVSHAYRHDASRQEDLLKRLNEPSVRLALHAYPRQQLDYANDVQMRTRSFNFFAMGALVAATLAQNNGKNRQVRLNIPENGLIAINPPLTNRRIGALSTRTTHPYYLGMLQQVFAVVGLGVELHNPFANMTKGEMILKCRDQIALKAIAWRTVSCGKWKRSGQQCGKCVPCLIRRASFHAAAWQDKTPYKAPGDDLHKALTHSADTDDLMAMILAARRLPGQDLLSWVAKSGPLPRDVAERSALVDVVRRGMAEVENFLTSKRVLR